MLVLWLLGRCFFFLWVELIILLANKCKKWSPFLFIYFFLFFICHEGGICRGEEDVGPPYSYPNTHKKMGGLTVLFRVTLQ